MRIQQYDLCIVNLDPTRGAEMEKTRHGVVLSPSEANKSLRTVVVAPVTSRIPRSRFRVRIHTESISGEIALDRIRSLDKSRVVKTVSKPDASTIRSLKATLKELLVD